jgi:Zn-dependent peptidase ImmA (M78 family)
MAKKSTHVRYAYAKTVAKEILRKHNISNVPISVIDVATNLEIDVYEYNAMLDSISALLDYNNKVVLINPKHKDVRKRFSIAHELGHYCLKHYDDQRAYLRTIEDNYNNNNAIVFKEYAQDQETEANEFAAELLMPEHLVLELFSKNPDWKKLADKFNVSSDAMWVRLSRLKLIDYSYGSKKN